MVGLDVALVNGIRPIRGSGDGITEYAYNMYAQLRKGNSVTSVYSIGNSRKNDISGLLKVNSELRRKVKIAASGDHDLLHIANQEVGFAAKVSKHANGDMPVVTTIHDVSRFEEGLQRGILQKAYNKMVRSSVLQAARYSDFILFDSTQTAEESKKRFDVRESAIVNIGIDKRFSAARGARRHVAFTVGYIGSFAYHKNVAMLLEAAKSVGDSGIRFSIYGVGNEAKALSDYKTRNGISWLELKGFASEASKVTIYDGFDVFVFPSLYEGFGLPILEAQARGLPVIVYKYGKIPKEIRKHCLEAEDPEHMAQIIADLKANGYPSRKKTASMEYARSFTWERCAAETTRVYHKLLAY